MNRRSLFKSLIGVVVAVSIDLGMSIPDVPAVSEKKVFKVMLNPEYAIAHYEDLIWWSADTNKPSEIRRFERSRLVTGPSFPSDLPARYNYINGEWVKVSPYIKIES